MTDNEIIKAYGCCNLSHDECGGCDNCPCKIEGDCIVPSGFELEREVFNLLNRQQAEIERLEDLNKCYYTSCQQIAKSNHEIKAESVKEFMERLKEKAFTHEIPFEANADKFVKLVAVEEIDNLVKEMVGEG